MSKSEGVRDPRSWWPWPAMPWPFGNLAPQQLFQPLNPGWAFGNVVTVTHLNSSAPAVEQEVLAHHSYGRQLGRLMDAVAALVEAAPELHGDERVRRFEALAQEVGRIKAEARRSGVERLRDELLELRRCDPEGWRRLADLFGP